jgi:primosomal protein N' (replication factor Y) (superfamily II helicase)
VRVGAVEVAVGRSSALTHRPGGVPGEWWDEGVAENERAGEQLTLLRSTVRAARSRRPKPRPAPAAELPVARVVVDVGLAHLDRPFDFEVPESMAAAAQPGVRVRVRFAGRRVDGFVTERAAASEHVGALAPLQRVVSPEPVLSPEVLRLARTVADRYAGTLADVLRLAVPPRHARVEAEPPRPAVPGDPPAPAAGGWARYEHGVALLGAVSAGATVRAAWSALPGPGWPDEIARLVAAALARGRGALVVLPDHRDLRRVDQALTDLVGPDRHVLLVAEAGPAERYRRWLRVRRGQVRAVLGTRAAAFAPVHDLGLAVLWDDGDDLHAEPRAPYPHVRTVLALRSAQEGSSLVVGGFARTVDTAALVRSGWLRAVVAGRDEVRRVAPRVVADDGSGDGNRGARLPTVAWQTAQDALAAGPVLVQVPRSGYLPGLACAECRRPARCDACRGPLAGVEDGPPACRWCGTVAIAWACPSCDGRRLRATVVGSRRTAEELGRAFPRTLVRTSGGTAPVLDSVGSEPAIVVATPGAEPVAEDGYAAALLLDGWALLGRPDLRAAEEALRRWTAAAALVRPAAAGGRVVLLADPASPPAQALVRWDQTGYADRELGERAALRLPPEARLVSLTGEPQVLAGMLAAAALPPEADVLGPVPAGDGLERVLVRAPRSRSAATVGALKAAAGVRSAHKEAGTVRLQVDPEEVG